VSCILGAPLRRHVLKPLPWPPNAVAHTSWHKLLSLVTPFSSYVSSVGLSQHLLFRSETLQPSLFSVTLSTLDQLVNRKIGACLEQVNVGTFLRLWCLRMVSSAKKPQDLAEEIIRHARREVGAALLQRMRLCQCSHECRHCQSCPSLHPWISLSDGQNVQPSPAVVGGQSRSRPLPTTVLH
jgi:hypothetical protein